MLSLQPKIGVWLALTALALQLALSFGRAHFFRSEQFPLWRPRSTGTIAKVGKIPAQEPARFERRVFCGLRLHSAR